MQTATVEAPALMLEPIPQASAPALRAEGNLAPQARTAAVITPADLLVIAMESGDKDIERLERLMAMDERYRESQERERQRQSVLAFRRDFAAFRGENVIIPKSKHVDRGRAGSFFQAEYDEVCRRLSVALSKHGFSFRHDQRFGVNEGSPWVWVTCFLEHRDGHAETLNLEGPPGDLSANTPVQNMQATASYLKRQSLLAITGTATAGEDDEAKLRRKGGGDEAGNDGADPLEPLRDAGRNAAMSGMASLTQWWAGLSPRQQKDMTSDFGSLRKAARQADEGAGQ